MRKRVISYAPAVAAGLCTVIAFSTNCALAAGDCVVQPNRQLAQDGHWYYHVDRVNYRKCWYLVEPRTRISLADVPAARPSPDAALQQAFSSFVSLLSVDFTGTKAAATQQDATNSDARALQTRPDDLRNGDGPRVKRVRVARHPDFSTAGTARLNRQSPTGPHGGRTDQPRPFDQAERDAQVQEFLRWKPDERPAPPLDQGERDVLFHEFLRWKARQTP
jgi:hypothetical protein